ncbi:MAG: Flp pilus assembly protein CpaB [Oligoflexia bacterium]|nr:Flp pilus assembly protein CpaB [Oligoflexia bacterium]
MGGSKTLLISAVLTLFAVILVYTYIDAEEKRLTAGTTMVDVLVATVNIPEYISLEPRNFEIKQYPIKYTPPNFLSNPKDIEETVSAVPIAKGEVVTTTKLLFLGSKTGLAPVVTKGQRAIAIRASSLNAVANLIKPGDRIDIVAVINTIENNAPVTTVKTALQDVLVLSIGENVYTQIPRFERGTGEFPPCVQRSSPASPQFNNLTVEASPKEAQVLIALSNMAKLFYTLRNPNDRGFQTVTPTSQKEITQ